MRFLASGLSIGIGLLMLIIGALFAVNIGCWSGCNTRDIANLSPLLVPGLVVLGTSIWGWRLIGVGTRPAIWAPLLFGVLGLLAIGAAALLISFGISDPIELFAPTGLLVYSVAQFWIAVQLWRPSAP